MTTDSFDDTALSLELARVSETAALASAELIGRGDEKAADQAAVGAMRAVLNSMNIRGKVVIGEGERSEASTNKIDSDNSRNFFLHNS